jgi:predicted MFS family arabinose efflux permease
MQFLGRHQPALTLFTSLFTSQAGFLVLTPLLPDVAHDLGVSTATAGGLRIASGLAGGAVALTIALLGRRLGLRDLIAAGLLLVGVGAAAGAAAPSFELLVASQLALGAGNAVVLSSGVAAAARWSSAEGRARALSVTLLGQPAAWVVGMPLVGVLAGSSWRLAMCMPLIASAIALAIVLRREADRPQRGSRVGVRSLLKGDRAIAGWAAGELLAYAGWGGTLTFAGALMIESYGSSPGLVGALLGIAAIAYFPGNLLARRWARRDPARSSALLASGLAAGLVVFGVARPGLAFSLGLFALLVVLAGGRALCGTAAGLEAAPDAEVTVMSIRASAMQFGMVAGAALGGVALAAGGYALLGVALAAFFAAGALPHAALVRMPPTTSLRPLALAEGS